MYQVKSRPPRLLIGLVGVVAAAAALAVGELSSAFFQPNPSPLIAVGNRVVDWSPEWLVNFGKAVFGLSDKVALIGGTAVLTLAFGGLLAQLASRRWRGAYIGLAVFGVVSLLAIGTNANSGWFYAIVVTSLILLVAIAVIRFGLGQLASSSAREVNTEAQDVEGELDADESDFKDKAVSSASSPDRRKFLVGMAAVAGAALAATGTSISTKREQAATKVREVKEKFSLLKPTEAPLAAQVEAAVAHPINSTPGIKPVVVPTGEFYLIDTALTRPSIDATKWDLKIQGLVDTPQTYSYEDLINRATVSAPVTLSCVSNPVGGKFVGNAVWQGIPLSDLLEEAGVQPEAEQLASKSFDGWTCGFPVEAAFDGRTAMVAVGMNGELLDTKHGFPARLVVSGLYGYVSATKWLTEINLTTWDGFDGYWIPRGWSKRGPVKLQSRVDTPSEDSKAAGTGKIPIAGVAWAPNTGVSKVEVRVGSRSADTDGEWVEAEIADPIGKDSWVQWRYDWEPTDTGGYTVEVRATDANGEVQPEEQTEVAPNGATGWHMRRFSVV